MASVNVKITAGCDVAVSSPNGEWVSLEPGDVVAVSQDKADNLTSNGCGEVTDLPTTRPFAPVRENPGGSSRTAPKVNKRTSTTTESKE